MKRFLCLLFLLETAASAGAYPYAHTEYISKLGPERFLAQKVLNQGTLTYCVFTAPDQKQTSVTQEELALMLQSALREWTYGIALRIEKTGRAEEFADILAILKKPLNLQQLPVCDLTRHPRLSVLYPDVPARGQKADISLLFAPDYCAYLNGTVNSAFFYDYNQAPPFICLTDGYANSVRAPEDTAHFPLPAQNDPAANAQDQTLLADAPQQFARIAQGKYTLFEQETFWRLNRLFEYDGHTFFDIIIHEVGHAFGLGDEYKTQRPKRYASIHPGQGLMQNGYRPLSCDETDGLITLLDRFHGKARTFESFCPGRHLIVNGTEYAPTLNLPAQQLGKQLRAAARNAR